MDTGIVPIWQDPFTPWVPVGAPAYRGDPDIVAQWQAGSNGPPPVARLVGSVITELYRDAVTFEIPAAATGWLLTPRGRVAGGALAVLADAALGVAVIADRVGTVVSSTVAMEMDFLRPVSPGEALVARGRLLDRGEGLALSDCDVTNARGRLLAHGTARNITSDVSRVPPRPADATTGDPLVNPPPDPWQRAVVGEPLAAELWATRTGAEILVDQIAGRLPMPPIHHLTGLRPARAGEGQATFILPASIWLTNPAGVVQGGALTLLAEAAMEAAVQTTCGREADVFAVDQRINFLRPAAGDGSEVEARATVAHRGRTIAVATAELMASTGKTVATATSTVRITGPA